MGSFNWQDEDSNWDVSQNIAEAAEGQQAEGGLFRNSRLTRIIGLMAVCLASLALFLWWWVDSVEQDLSADVLESWRIVRVSDAADDVELFTNQLSGSDLDWIVNQKLLLERGLLTARGGLLPSLVLAEVETVAAEPTIEFSPDLTEAVLSHPVTYRDRWGRDVVLLQDEIFRLGSDRWLFSPPKASYWQIGELESETRYSNRFAYSSPPKDREMTEKIILWFEDRLDLICMDEFSYACRKFETPQIEIEFSPNLTNRLLVGSFHRQRSGDLLFVFPTPSLIGVPASERDEQLLVEAYGELFFGEYLLNVIRLEHNLADASCVRELAEYAAQQSDALAPITVDDYANYIEFASKINREDGSIALNDAARSEFMRLSTKLIIHYRLQDRSLTPQMLIEAGQAAEVQTSCNLLFFNAQEKWDEFNRFVEVRAAVGN